jgi:hypothetical protein
MKCADCGRRLLKFDVSYPTPEGEIGWGPVCGRAHVIARGRVVRTAAPTMRRYRRAKPDVTQLALEFA